MVYWVFRWKINLTVSATCHFICTTVILPHSKIQFSVRGKRPSGPIAWIFHQTHWILHNRPEISLPQSALLRRYGPCVNCRKMPLAWINWQPAKQTTLKAYLRAMAFCLGKKSTAQKLRHPTQRRVFKTRRMVRAGTNFHLFFQRPRAKSCCRQTAF
jgi:hypothetical protein